MGRGGGGWRRCFCKVRFSFFEGFFLAANLHGKIERRVMGGEWGPWGVSGTCFLVIYREGERGVVNTGGRSILVHWKKKKEIF